MLMKHYLKVPSIPREESTVSILEHEVTIIGTKGRAHIRALFDSGASYSIIRREIAERIGMIQPFPEPEDWIFETARAGDYIQPAGNMLLQFRFDDSEARFSDEFVVFDELSEELIVGATTMQKWHILPDFTTETISYRKTVQRLRV
jgi:hypothetical protein